MELRGGSRASKGRVVAGLTLLLALGGGLAAGVFPGEPGGEGFAPGTHVVLGTNDLGMHCMQQDYADFLVLPPYNTLHAQVIRRGRSPEIIEGDISVTYMFGENTRSADKVNFWDYAPALFGVTVPPNTGLTGSRMRGTMARTANKDWAVTGIPITPIRDDGREDAYQLATITAMQGATVLARTQAVVPVSWEIGCNLCHGGPSESVGDSVLRLHDQLHQTTLATQRPVNCSTCHADPALGAPGVPGVSTFSAAMHGAHADRPPPPGVQNSCYACHPGERTDCQRDLHASRGLTCTDCHGGMVEVGSPLRTPWVDVPKCGGCHTRNGFEFEEPGKLFKESRGHGGVTCLACHGSPHAMGPAVTNIDNHQALVQQDMTGPIRNCLVCHTSQPEDPFPHRRDD